jgi:hypothetical protein
MDRVCERADGIRNTYVAEWNDNILKTKAFLNGHLRHYWFAAGSLLP